MGLHQIMNNVHYVIHTHILNISMKEMSIAQPFKKSN
jgi:hypothetical protein